jgi:transcriptional regulator with XRE-family HTH domain
MRTLKEQHPLPRHPLARWREDHEISQAELAQKVQVRQMSISRYEHGQTPESPILKRLCEFTGLPPQAFVYPERFRYAEWRGRQKKKLAGVKTEVM